MIVPVTEWHPSWVSYEWWADIGAAVIGVATATAVGLVTLLIAWRSHRLTEQVAAREAARVERERVERYEGRLLAVVEPAMTQMLEYVGTIDLEFERPQFFASQAGALARLTLVDAVAEGEDELVTSALVANFGQLVRHRNPGVHMEVAGEWTGHLAALVGRKHSADQLVAWIEGAIGRAEKLRKKIK